MRIVAKGLTHVYNPKSSFATQALKGVDLTIEEGEFFGIIGHTGSGKSTFVQHLNALIRLTGGELKGAIVSPVQAMELARLLGVEIRE